MRTYGDLSLFESQAGPFWQLAAEPHIMLRAKRVFERMQKSPTRVAMLSHSPENCRDLLWFLDRYPLRVSAGDMELLNRGADAFRERILTLEMVVGGHVPPPPFELALPPREYQRLAAAVYLRNGHLLLADDVGLGKTVSAIATLTDPRTLPACVVTLSGAMPKQWQDEIAKFSPGLRSHVLKKGRPYELPKHDGKPPDVLILNYHKLSGWADVIAEYCQSIIFDEAQELRRAESDKYAAASAIAKRLPFRLGLTATPIYNYGGEIFNVVDCIAPGSLGTRQEFAREWAAGDTSGQAKIKDPQALGSFLRENFIMLRRTRAEVGRELPPVTKVTYPIDSDRDALDKIEGTAAELANIILSGTAESRRGERMNAAEELSNVVRQATGIAKAPYVADFVRMIVEGGERVVLYGWHRAVYEIWQAKLADMKPVWYTGSESPTQKVESRAKFIAGESPIIFMSLRAGAGLDGLQHVCSTVVFGELDWSPGVHEQCLGRIYRDGQPNPVMCYHLVAEDGSDPIVAEVLGLKREQVEGLRNPNADLIEKLDAAGGHIAALAKRYLKSKAVAA